ncbi:MAG: helix-turn-helix domain-containing protein [Brachybacterium tyrofermentans]|uniref:AraC family transcriptional regulator n=1 Tax=Brachybacterium TaxID=43668 RepID=UPI001867FD3A|nr:helix-turn-helix domain-containing protein [Brachybacterium tyrofermentans]
MRLRPRVHAEADLVLWCRTGCARVGVSDAVPGAEEARPLAVPADSALLLRAGQRHTVEVPAGTLLHPVFLPPRGAPGTGSPTGSPVVEVDRGLAAALLALSVAGTTDLRPAESRLRALGEAVRSRMAGGASHRMRPPPTSHIEWVTNRDEHVLVIAAFGPATVMVRDVAGGCAAVDLAEHMALAVPPGVPHRILTREAGVALPVFHHGTGLSLDGAEGRIELMYLPARTRLRAEHHAVAGSSALRPPGFDETALPRALAGLVQRTGVLRLDGGAPAPVDLLRERVIRDPAGSWSPATWERLEGGATAPCPHRRTLERAVREATGTGFVSWRNQVRAEQAEDLLAAGMPVKTVARRMGFAHASGFSRAFRQVTGAAPESVTRRTVPGDLAPPLPPPVPPWRAQTRSRP